MPNNSVAHDLADERSELSPFPKPCPTGNFPELSAGLRHSFL